MKTSNTYTVEIFVGFRESYSEVVHNMTELEAIVDQYIKDIDGDCVTITPTTYRYKGGWENGAIIGWITYPRIPREPEELIRRAMSLSSILLKKFNQERISIVTPEITYMLESQEDTRYEEGDIVVASFGWNDLRQLPYEELYEYGYPTRYGHVVYVKGERNMQDARAFKTNQLRKADLVEEYKIPWGK